MRPRLILLIVFLAGLGLGFGIAGILRFTAEPASEKFEEVNNAIHVALTGETAQDWSTGFPRVIALLIEERARRECADSLMDVRFLIALRPDRRPVAEFILTWNPVATHARRAECRQRLQNIMGSPPLNFERIGILDADGTALGEIRNRAGTQ